MVTVGAAQPQASVAATHGWPLGGLLAAVLVFDGLLTLVLEVLFLPLYVGRHPFPITAVIAAVVNVLLVRAMGLVVTRPAAMGLPLIAWLFGYLVCASPGPGGDIMLAADWTAALLLALGLAPAAVYLFRRRFHRFPGGPLFGRRPL